MVIQFSNKEDAKAYVDKVHEWLQMNCPRYNAERWAEVDDSLCIQMPQEWVAEKELYKDAKKIIDFCRLDSAKAVQTMTDEQYIKLREKEIKPKEGK